MRGLILATELGTFQSNKLSSYLAIAAIKNCFMLWNMKNDLLPACDFQISLTINCESTWPGLLLFGCCTLRVQLKKSLLADDVFPDWINWKIVLSNQTTFFFFDDQKGTLSNHQRKKSGLVTWDLKVAIRLVPDAFLFLATCPAVTPVTYQ